jgi:hypothetical protein
MVDLGRVDATIAIGDGVRLKSLPDSKLPAANAPYRRGFPRGRGLLFPRPPSGGPAPEGFFLVPLRSVRGSIRDWVGCPCRPRFPSRRDVDAVLSPSRSHCSFDSHRVASASGGREGGRDHQVPRPRRQTLTEMGSDRLPSPRTFSSSRPDRRAEPGSQPKIGIRKGARRGTRILAIVS